MKLQYIPVQPSGKLLEPLFRNAHGMLFHIANPVPTPQGCDKPSA
jgi:hypothetical protein